MDYKLLRYKIYEQYGEELDETSLIILYILNDYQEKQFGGQNRKLDEAVRSINRSGKSLQVDTQHPFRQAFWFGFGKLGFALVFMTTVVSVFLGVYQNNHVPPTRNLSKEQSDTSEKSYPFRWYKTYYLLSQKDDQSALASFVKKYPAPKDK